ncbi:translation elongation factor 4 [Desulfococcus multivorans]|uniref:Elongation factor 4 n=1 Tax=Desulfococcus multivorans DSM 2059 TaxID=1121405 RepID=S7TCL6_DESML|nr:translation elongation factor 4 [Desulfococcus multivorans]AOY60174.1 LepA: elongation factor 4,GTP-binding protein [Desulfococcus multivorans]AQV02303.1 elongation factor 4 [Desulfococcus multivorans]EPR34245.1 GTP-binding protein lepA [Desulfococcus multivorans DSM 2059]SKA06221.1 GTP-binding protein LepA [Desulfococcus multivorans DSM 2059]
MEHIRNFSIIAHIDHGKSTLSDRLIQAVHIVADRDFKDQILDTMDIERERGITIKSQTVCLPYTAKNGKTYSLNLIDTPGHVDFSYEVSRALASCEGAFLLVDASQGAEAQTLANLYLAMEHNLEVIPVINKIDLPSADIERVREQIEDDLGLDPERVILTSAKEGIGIEDVLEAAVNFLPPPKGDPDKPLRALIFDSHYDPFRGTIVHFRVFDGRIKAGDTIQFMSNNARYKVEEVGIFQIVRKPRKVLSAGDVGYMIAGIKTVSDTSCGDTITLKSNPCDAPMPGFRESKPVVFSSIYPVASDEYEDLAVGLEKLKLNDSALIYEKDSSAALGFGFRCGFLGLLHLEVVQERLEREYDLSLILTAPSVQYEITLNDGEVMIIDNPSLYPDPSNILMTREPYIRAAIIVPDRYMGAVMKLCLDRRGINRNYQYLTRDRLEMIFELPLAEVIYDFYDKLKSVTQGYGSFDYDILEFRETDLVKLDILINGERVDALSQLVHRDRAVERGRRACEKLKEEIPRQMYKIAIQGAIGAKIVARTTISPFRKDVTAKCYGGDITRKRKLLEKQKKGKKRMKMVGQVEIPQSAFLSVLKTED